jgi:hypothetical protein
VVTESDRFAEMREPEGCPQGLVAGVARSLLS